MATNTKKRKRNVVLHQGDPASGVDTSKPTAVFQPKKGREHTLSIALPGSVISNAQTYELKISLAGTIARACAVFSVDEVIIFDDGQSIIKTPRNPGHPIRPDDEPWQDPNQFLYHILSYVETPPHLRKYLFPMHPSLRGAGALPSLDMPHHLKADEWCRYREGVVVSPNTSSSVHPSSKKAKVDSSKKSSASTTGALIDCGFPSPVSVADSIPPNSRVTLKFASAASPASFPALSELYTNPAALSAEATSPAAPREEAGYFWGYTTRRCASLSAVFTECSFEGGYDVSIGTSERGVALSELLAPAKDDKPAALPTDYQHLLLVFGGVAGIEAAIGNDKEFAERGVTKERAGEVFDQWVNLVPGQGSRTIRTEEAVWLGLMGMRGFVERREG
ncbi:DUF171-domain-containing protein [Lophium mytilinum]|uniref:DUF171-domain-containing protein n=1 Tax=Lophium mytilinum TaxID=390894 RepID=A0A6A6Q8V4_9PEZI|nr:DUF171-domain-containing protein [Lophium mytilinum]